VFELGAVAAIVGALLVVAGLDGWSAMALGAGLAGLGLLASMAVGLVYHLRTREHLRRLGRLPRLWWLAPTRLHRLMDEPARAAALPWFRAGVGFMAVHGAGLIVFLAGAAKVLWFQRGP
jgi:hypothetical protein